jgi:signal transduction histidine kinase
MIRMKRTVRSTYAERIAERMARESQCLAAQWLDRLAELLPLDAYAIFPTAELLDHIPLLIEQIADYLRAPAEREIAVNTAVIGKAQDLGQLRYRQQASVHQILREYDILADLLEHFVIEETAKLSHAEYGGEDCLGIAARLGHAVRSLMQTTVDTFVGEYTATIVQQTERLESFNRMLVHELRTPLGTLLFAVEMLNRSDINQDLGAYRHLVALLRRNVDQTIRSVRGLERLVFTERAVDAPNQQRANLSSVANEVARQLADMAATRGVEIRIDPHLPEVVTDTGQLELVLMNLVSNAIKYSDPTKRTRYVEIASGEDRQPGTETICVRDNGIGIPSDAIGAVFTRFFRGNPERDEELHVEGSGLGLSIVEESARLLGGQIRVHSVEGQGTAFYITVPNRWLA